MDEETPPEEAPAPATIGAGATAGAGSGVMHRLLPELPEPPPRALWLLCRASSHRIAAALTTQHEEDERQVVRGAAVLMDYWRDWQAQGPGFGDVQIERSSVDVGLSVLYAIAPQLRDRVFGEDAALWISDEIEDWWSAARAVPVR